MPTTKPYGSTTVPVSKSQEELRGLLRKFGADQFTLGEGRDFAGVEFLHDDVLVRMRCPVVSDEAAIERDTRHVGRAEKEATASERERARVWRVLVWTVKARLVAVEEGIETFEQAFLAHLVNPSTGRTIWQDVGPEIELGGLRLGSGGIPALGRGASS